MQRRARLRQCQSIPAPAPDHLNPDYWDTAGGLVRIGSGVVGSLSQLRTLSRLNE